MTVSTPYFDYVFEAKEEVTEELAVASRRYARLERKEDRLEALIERRPTANRLRRLERVKALSDFYEEEVEILTEDLEDLNQVELPKDEAEFSFYKREDSITGIQVTVTDSPYDDTYVGGVKTALYLSGNGKYNGNGFAGFGTRAGLIPDTFEDATDTFMVGGSIWSGKLDGSYPNVTVSLLQGWDPNSLGSGDPCFETPIYSDGVAQIA